MAIEIAKSFTEETIPPDRRTFEIGGEVFKWRYPYWGDFADKLDEDYATVNAARENGGKKKPEENPNAVREMYEDYIKRIEPYIEPENDGLERWKRLVERKKDPVPAYVFQNLFHWLVEVTTKSPTTQPSPSGDGQKETDSSSKEGSS